MSETEKANAQEQKPTEPAKEQRPEGPKPTTADIRQLAASLAFLTGVLGGYLRVNIGKVGRDEEYLKSEIDKISALDRKLNPRE